MSTLAVGIDLGTANTRVGVYRNDDFEIIPYEDGRSMPSYVSFGDKQRLFGADAKRQANRNPENTVFNVLRLVGRDFKDKGLQDDLNYLPFRVVGDETPLIQVRYLGREVQFTPEEILAMILSKAKQNAEAYLRATVKEVQISVPADFGIRKYDAVRDAAAIAGLEVIELLPSPTCASYVLGVGRPEKDIYSYVLVDAGAGGLSVSVLSSEEGVHEVLSVAGDPGLGGEDFLKNLVFHFAGTIKSMWNKDIAKTKRAIQRLRGSCEQAIRDLSSAQSTQIHIESLYEGRDFYHHLTRQDFESFSVLLLQRMRATVDQALDEAKVAKSEVKYVFPLGGCSRMPQIRKLLSDYFEGKDLDGFLDTEEAQVHGLAAGCSVKMGEQSNSRLAGSLLISVLPKSLGVGTLGAPTEFGIINTRVGLVDNILRKNSMMISKRDLVCSLPLEDCDPSVPHSPQHGKAKPTGSLSSRGSTIVFYEGEGLLASDNERVGTLQLGPILPAPGPEGIDLKIELYARNGFQVQATATTFGARHELHNSRSVSLGNRMAEKRLQRLIADEAEYRKADDAEAQRVDQRVELDQRISYLSEMLSADSEVVVKKKPDLPGILQSMRTWMEENEDASLDQYRSRQQILNSIQWDLQDKGTQSQTNQATPDPAPPYEKDPDAKAWTPRSPSLLRKEIREVISWLDRTRNEFDERKKQLEQTLEGLTDIASDPSDGEADDPDPKDRNGGTPSSAPPHKRPPSMDAAERFASHFNGSKQTYTPADLDMISAYLRTQGEEKHSRNPKLYTVLRLIDGLHLFDHFVERGVSDALIPRLSYESLPPAINMEIARKFMGRRSVVLEP
ncbi:hypothetical protein PG984_008335 [Apiospora sp. TS-2023a]